MPEANFKTQQPSSQSHGQPGWNPNSGVTPQFRPQAPNSQPMYAQSPQNSGQHVSYNQPPTHNQWQQNPSQGYQNPQFPANNSGAWQQQNQNSQQNAQFQQPGYQQPAYQQNPGFPQNTSGQGYTQQQSWGQPAAQPQGSFNQSPPQMQNPQYGQPGSWQDNPQYTPGPAPQQSYEQQNQFNQQNQGYQNVQPPQPISNLSPPRQAFPGQFNQSINSQQQSFSQRSNYSNQAQNMQVSGQYMRYSAPGQDVAPPTEEEKLAYQNSTYGAEFHVFSTKTQQTQKQMNNTTKTTRSEAPMGAEERRKQWRPNPPSSQ